MKTYAKGERKKKLPVVILSVALGMTMIPATCMAAEFNSGDTIKEQTVEDLELSSGENNTYQKSEWKKTDEVQSAVYQFRSAALTTVKLTTPGLSGTSNSPAGIVFKWKKAANASGYKIYRRTGNSSKWVNIATVSGSNTLVYTDGSVKAGTMYTYTVRAYKGSALSAYNKNGSRIVRLTAPVQYKPSSKASGKLTVRWKKAVGASGYQIQYAASRSMRGARTVSTSALTRTLSGLKKGSTYYVRIRAYKKVSGKTYYGAWSSVKNVKVRK